ncbi:MAG TPA: hypothetical protein VNU97_17700 [Rhizomicrobium sp.]|jgi:hypothetical protein|nr:hypothetical protein [Rhizomicrobium sp.]
MAGFVEGLASAAGKTVEYFGPQARRILIGFVLVFAFFATGTVLLFVLAADQLQSSMSAPGLLTVKSSIGAIRQDVASVEYYYKVLDVITSKQVETEEALNQANIEAQSALSRMTSSADDINAFITQNDTGYIRPPLVLQHFGQTAPAPAPAKPAAPAAPQNPQIPMLGMSPGSIAHAPAPPPPNPALAQSPILDFGSAVTGYFADYYAQLNGMTAPDADAARAALDTFRNQVYKSLQAYTAAHAQYDSSTSSAQSLKAQLGALSQQKSQLDDNVAPKGSPLANDEYWNLCEDFYSFKTLVGDWAYKIVLLPKMMLILTLSIFMGVLGSLIYLSQEFVRDPDCRNIWDILFRISLGAGVAFALFFFAAAGMLAMSQSSSGAAQSDMSPYLISFLGITGGYLSDRVTQWMREVGENAFKVDAGGPPPRWAVGLDAALKAAGLDAAALASASAAPQADVASWIALQKPVPGDKQGLIAAFMRMHPSHLFTDIAPG